MNRLYLQVNSVRPLDGGPRSFTPFPSGQQEALLDLGRSMYKHGIVPEIPSARPSPSSSEHSLRVYTGGSIPPDNPQPNPSTPTVFPPPLRCSPRRSVPPDKISKDPTTAGATSMPNPANSRPAGKTLRFDDLYVEYESIAGFISAPSLRSRQCHVTAKLWRDEEINIISIGKARSLGLDVELVDQSESVTVSFGTAYPQRSIGKATFLWSKSAHRSARFPPLTVECEVFEIFQEELVLGRPFLEERKNRWMSRNGSSRSV